MQVDKHNLRAVVFECMLTQLEVPENPLRNVEYSISLVLDGSDILGIEGRPTQGGRK